MPDDLPSGTSMAETKSRHAVLAADTATDFSVPARTVCLWGKEVKLPSYNPVERAQPVVEGLLANEVPANAKNLEEKQVSLTVTTDQNFDKVTTMFNSTVYTVDCPPAPVQ